MKGSGDILDTKTISWSAVMLILVSRLQLINMKTASDFEVVVFQNKGQQSSGVGSW